MKIRKITNKEKPGVAQEESNLVKLVKYIISQDPKSVMKLIYESGYLPYGHQEPVNEYLLRNAISIAHEEGEEGIKRLMYIHPDKNLILDLFAASYERETSDPDEDEEEESNFLGKPLNRISDQSDNASNGKPAMNALAFLGLIGICFLLFYLIS